MDSKMIIYFGDGLTGEIELEVSPDDTLAEVKKRLIEKGAAINQSQKIIAHGRVLAETRSLRSQGLSAKSKLHHVGHRVN